jgi:hypothetical protein
MSIGRSHPGALVQHPQSVTDYLDTLADILYETAVQIRGDAETLGGCRVPGVTGAQRFPSETQWREYQAAVTAINAKDADDKDLGATFREAQDRIVYTEDATLQGIYPKLRLLAETESLSSDLDEGDIPSSVSLLATRAATISVSGSAGGEIVYPDPADRRRPGLDRRVHRAILTQRGRIQVVTGCL